MDLDRTHHRAVLLRRAGDGDEAAFADFYDETVADAVGLARTLVTGERGAQLVTERAFREVWRECARYDAGSDDPTSWLLALVRLNASLERYRVREDHDDLARRGRVGTRH